jgi:hypothetical protein
MAAVCAFLQSLKKSFCALCVCWSNFFADASNQCFLQLQLEGISERFSFYGKILRWDEQFHNRTIQEPILRSQVTYSASAVNINDATNRLARF